MADTELATADSPATKLVRTYSGAGEQWTSPDLDSIRGRVNRVYYIRLAGYIKIGTTINLVHRLHSYPPMVELLAIEPGDRTVETARHQQFAHLRCFGKNREWFSSGPDLEHHIAELRQAVTDERRPKTCA